MINGLPQSLVFLRK